MTAQPKMTEMMIAALRCRPEIVVDRDPRALMKWIMPTVTNSAVMIAGRAAEERPAIRAAGRWRRRRRS